MPAKSQSTRPKVAAIVLNSVSHDVRVLKEASSLQAAGYQVTVIGIRDNRCNDPETLQEDGVRIVRCAWRGPMYHCIAKGVLIAGVLGAILLLALLMLAAGPVFNMVKRAAASDAMPAIVALILAGIPLTIALSRLHRRIALAAGRYEAMDGPASSETGVVTAMLLGSRLPALRRIRTFLSYQGFLQFLSRIAGNRIKRREVLRVLASIGPDIVHCHDLSALPIGAAHKRRSKARLVYDSHEIYEDVSMMTPLRKRRLERNQHRLSNHVDLFITINDSIAAHLNNKYPKLPPAVVVRNAAMAGSHPPRDDGRLHDAAGLDRSVRILLYQGGFSRYRGLPILLRAAPLLPENWALVMMGWGTIEPELRALAQQLDPSGARIRFVPGAPLAELAQWTAGGSLGVIPYENVCLNHWFCTPNKLWEYPIAGVPILASDFPEMARTITEHGIGRLLPDPLTPDDIAAAVASVTDTELALMKRNCRRFIEQDNWSRYAERLTRSYAALIGRTNTSPDVLIDTVRASHATVSS